MSAVCMQGEGGSLSFFLKLAALCMVLLRWLKNLARNAFGRYKVCEGVQKADLQAAGLNFAKKF